MLTINTHIIKRGSLKEKIKNILEIIYNPTKAECMKRLYNKIQDIRKMAVYYPNSYIDTVSVTPPSECEKDLPILYYEELPEVFSEEVEDKYSKYTNYYFIHKEEFVNSNNETVILDRKVYLTNKKSYIAFICLAKDKDGFYSENSFHYVIYVPDYGFYNVDECIENPSMMFGKKNYRVKVIKDKKLYHKSKKLYSFYRAIVKTGNSVYNVLHTIDSVILCIRFPFLYPRNRFSDRHYNNYKLSNYIKALDNKANWRGNVRWPKDESRIREIVNMKDIHIKSRPCKKNKTLKCWYYIDENGEEVILNNKSLGIINVFKYHKKSSKDKLEDGVYCWSEEHGWMNLLGADSEKLLSFDHDDYESKYYHIVFDKKINFYIKCIEFFYDYILGFIFCIPTSNELDALDEGWMRKFGIDMCKELRKQLIKDKMLFSFRITQIKEKFGTLRFYVASASREVYSIIDKYEHISFSTCICCGEPAKYITSGWISPFCEHCVNKDSIESASILDENGNIIKDAYAEDDDESDE